MSSMGQRFFAGFGLLAGLATLFFTLQLLGQWLFPGVFGALPPWLPEDHLTGLGLSLLERLASWLPALAFSALLLTFSFWLRSADLPEGDSAPLVRFSLLAIGASVLFALVSLLGQPWVDAQLDALGFRQHQARNLEDAYLKLKAATPGTRAETRASFDARMALVKRLVLLRPDQAKQTEGERFDYDFELQILKAHFELDDYIRLRTLPESAAAPEESGTTIEELLVRGEEALADEASGREYQANLWGYQAYRRLMNAVDQGKAVDNRDRERAKAVVETSWERIYARTLAEDERLKASYFFRKGKSLGDYQFQNFLEAYYGFRELHEENPSDAEAGRYFELSQAKVAERILFRQDMEVLFAVPGLKNLVFRHRDNPLEIVRIGRLLDTSQGVYVRDFELLRLSPYGEVLLHWKAPYGRWGADGVDFHVWDLEKPQPYFPVVLQAAPNQDFEPEAAVDPPKFQPRVSVRDLEVVNADQPRPQTLGTMDLLLHGRAIETLGYNSGLFQTEFLLRLGTPFGFFLAFLFLFVLAWSARVHEPGRTWWFLVPALPLVMQFLSDSVLWLSKLGLGTMVALWGLEVTVGILTVSFVVLAAAGVVLAQGAFQRRDRDELRAP